MDIKKEALCDGVYFTAVTDEKFNSNHTTVRFVLPLAKETAAMNAIIPDMLSSCCESYPTKAELYKKLDRLYGAYTAANTSKSGDAQVLIFSANCIDNAYTIDGEDVNSEMADIIIGCLFSPAVEGDGFKESEFRLRRQSLADEIIASLNDKRGYAIKQAEATIFENEPAGISAMGTVEDVNALTPQDAYRQYRSILETARIEIHCIGCSDFSQLKKRFSDAFSKIRRSYSEVSFISKSPLKAEVKTVTEEYDVTQAKMVLGFKIAPTDRYAANVMNAILGATPFSKLFTNVREKMSLCYYCASGVDIAKGALRIDCGIESENTQKAKDAIIDQLEAVKNGDFSDEEAENAKLFIIDSLGSVKDSQYAISIWLFTQDMLGYSCDMDEMIAELSAVSRERITATAASAMLDTVYIMAPAAESGKEQAGK